MKIQINSARIGFYHTLEGKGKVIDEWEKLYPSLFEKYNLSFEIEKSNITPIFDEIVSYIELEISDIIKLANDIKEDIIIEYKDNSNYNLIIYDGYLE